MNRRSFLMGTTALVAGAALPHPNVPTDGEVNEALSYVTVEDAQLYASEYVSQPIGITLQSGKASDLVSVVLNHFGNSVMKTRIDRDMFAGEVLMSNDTGLWVGKSEDEIVEDILHMQTVLTETVGRDTITARGQGVYYDIET